jgi:hypothetical protein
MIARQDESTMTTNTTFSIELQGVNLPDEIKALLQAQLRSVVLSEIAKVDLSSELSIKALPQEATRAFPGRQILGIILTKLGTPTIRGGDALHLSPPPPSLLFTPPHSTAELVAAISGSAATSGGSLIDLCEPLYFRPDIRAAVTAHAQAFAELLSQDEPTTRILNEISDGALQPGPERFGPAIVAIIAAGVATGALLAYINRHRH